MVTWNSFFLKTNYTFNFFSSIYIFIMGLFLLYRVTFCWNSFYEGKPRMLEMHQIKAIFFVSMAAKGL